MSSNDYSKEKLWPILVEAVHALIMYPHHKAYVNDIMLHETPGITAAELAFSLKISLGEAIVILFELDKGHNPQL